MDGGVIVEDGTPAEVIGNPSHERTRHFLSRLLDPAMAELADAGEGASGQAGGHVGGRAGDRKGDPEQ
jgi:polar amino acid transport system ATP-binding protein